MDYYQIKDKSYYSHSRQDIIELVKEIPVEQAKILEVGASGAYTLLSLKKLGLASEVVGLDLFELPNSEQKNPDIDQFIVDDIEKSLSLPFAEAYFDIITFPDVLEHLRDPWEVLSHLEKYLKKGGHILVSVPNIRHYTSLLKIFIQGDFAYAEEGIFDKTHLRYFCRKNIIQLVDHIDTLEVKKYYPGFVKDPAQIRRRRINRLTFGLLNEFLSSQHLLIIEKIH